jgi:hypothetical protein
MISQRERELKAEVKRLKKQLRENDYLIQKAAMKMARLEAAQQSLCDGLAASHESSPGRKKG